MVYKAVVVLYDMVVGVPMPRRRYMICQIVDAARTVGEGERCGYQ
jgi:hypothetical protein